MTLANMTQAETNRTNTEHCKSIAETLDKIANGELYRCPECGEWIDADDVEDVENFKCSECGGSSRPSCSRAGPSGPSVMTSATCAPKVSRKTVLQ